MTDLHYITLHYIVAVKTIKAIADFNKLEVINAAALEYVAVFHQL